MKTMTTTLAEEAPRLLRRFDNNNNDNMDTPRKGFSLTAREIAIKRMKMAIKPGLVVWFEENAQSLEHAI